MSSMNQSVVTSVYCNPFASSECGFEATSFFATFAAVHGVIVAVIAVYFMRSRVKSLTSLRALFQREFVLDRLILCCGLSAMFSLVWCALRSVSYIPKATTSNPAPTATPTPIAVIVFFAIALQFLHVAAASSLFLWDSWKPQRDRERSSPMAGWVSVMIHIATFTSILYVILGPVSVAEGWTFMAGIFAVMLANCVFDIVVFTYEGLSFFRYYSSLMPKKTVSVPSSVVSKQFLLFRAIFWACVVAFGVWMGLQVWGVYVTTLFDGLAGSNANNNDRDRVMGCVYATVVFMALSQFFIPALMIWMELYVHRMVRRETSAKRGHSGDSSTSESFRERDSKAGSTQSRRSRRERLRSKNGASDSDREPSTTDGPSEIEE